MAELLAQGGGALSEEAADEEFDQLDGVDELDAELGDDVVLDEEEPAS